MKRIALLIAALSFSASFSAPAAATELFGGAFVHDVKTPLTKSGIESGVDLAAGLRGGNIGPTPLQPYAFVAFNTAGETNYGAIGLSAKFGDSIYFRPGLGLAVHTGSTKDFSDPDDGKIDFGSRILFEPEVSVGAKVNGRISVEASWVHMSHATLFSRQNPGIDNFGVRLNLKL